MKKSSLFGILAAIPVAVLSTSAYANYSVTVASTGGRAVVAHYPVADGYNTSKDFLNGYMELQVAGRGRIAFNDISGAPCSSWGVFVTYGTKVYTYYYEGAGQLTVSIAANGDLTLTTSNGKIVPKVPGQCT